VDVVVCPQTDVAMSREMVKKDMDFSFFKGGFLPSLVLYDRC
jgi:hypothetical protein